MTGIYRNSMAANAATNLNSHYSRLAVSTERLSTGLRINSASDDAAGLAIRELMRAEVAALNQGMRNASDAISMLQVADGALAIIDEKLIRMKELAEQAATGTYNSTQRLIIDSEYKAMAAEIDRIANATDFNGINLLDGSLSGRHNGSGLNAAGALKIHFGSGNDSAEDYYYVEIGACTSAALGLGTGGIGGSVEYTKIETWETGPVTFIPQGQYELYTDPDTGTNYYYNGDFYFRDYRDPAATRLDWQTDGEIIKKLKLTPQIIINATSSYIYIDPDTGTDYYTLDGGKTFTHDPYDSDAGLDASNPDEKAIIDRLQRTNNQVRLEFKWEVYEDPNGKEYFTYNNGATFVPDRLRPTENILRNDRPEDQAIIAGLTYKPVFGGPGEYATYYNYKVWVDKTTSKKYYSTDNGQTFVSSPSNPSGSQLDPVKDRDLILRLEPDSKTINKSVDYDIYLWDNDENKRYYTKDGGKTFISNLAKPDQIAFSVDNPADAASIARLTPYLKKEFTTQIADVYEDPANSSKQYYTVDKGKTFFDNLSDPAGTLQSAADLANAGINLVKVDSTAQINTQFGLYRDPVTNTRYYSQDGITFLSQITRPDSALDPNNTAQKTILDRLEPICATSAVFVEVKAYTDPVFGITYYEHPEKDGRYINTLGNVALDPANPAQLTIINRLQELQDEMRIRVVTPYPDEYEVFVYPPTGGHYYTSDGGKTFTTRPDAPGNKAYILDPANNAGDQAIIDALTPLVAYGKKTEYVATGIAGTGSGAGATISTQQSAQQALVAIDRAIVSKDAIRAHLGALQNRLENTVSALSIQAENLQAAEARLSDADIAQEMTNFVRNQVLTQSAVAMLGQANSYPHMLMQLIQA